MVTTKQKHTASELVLLAASDLTAAGNQEFSEWDLTVAAWSIDRFRFGLRGYAQSYPDHKRVMMEIMGQKPSSPVQQKYLEKVRPNFYRLTPLGRTAASRLRGGPGSNLPEPQATAKPVTVKELYETAAVYVNRPEFRRWQDNPEEPRDWSGAAAFLGILKGEKVDAAERMDEVREAIKDAMDWCKVQEAAFLTRGSGQGGTPIHVRDLSEMIDFLQALSYRFPEYLDRKKPRKRFD
ncbi:MAG TPA: hypothetical protein VGI99_11350 [Gemmataceae bacterium]|jgi:hypothetical protein|nr:hypothetical protein [Urbifossiella sp.]